jgi:hypothetical protein
MNMSEPTTAELIAFVREQAEWHLDAAALYYASPSSPEQKALATTYAAIAARLEQAERMEAERDRLRVALGDLVSVNEQWNADVEAVIGRPPKWTDGYLDAARAALAPTDATVPRG